MLPVLPLLLLPCLAGGHHVMVFHNLGTSSHIILLKPLVQELLQRGNSVTAILFHSLAMEHDNLTEVLLATDLEQLRAEGSKVMMSQEGLSFLNPQFWLWIYDFYQVKVAELAMDMLQAEGVQKMMREEVKVDVVITFYPWGAVFGELFDCPVIIFAGSGPMPYSLTGTTDSINYSLQPLIFAPFIEPMTLSNRLVNHALAAFISAFFDQIAVAMHGHQQELLGPGRPLPAPRAIQEQRVALVLACSHPVTHGAWPRLPNVIEVGGLHLRAPLPLPDDLAAFLASAQAGAVLVSFGSSLRADQMPEEHVKVFLEAFRLLGRTGRAVVWKWELEVADLPPNVLVRPWLPQQDILAHPNLKVFVTHGGMGSMVEAVFHKAVLVGIPLSQDQKPNILRTVKDGYSVRLEWGNFTDKDIYIFPGTYYLSY